MALPRSVWVVMAGVCGCLGCAATGQVEPAESHVASPAKRTSGPDSRSREAAPPAATPTVSHEKDMGLRTVAVSDLADGEQPFSLSDQALLWIAIPGSSRGRIAIAVSSGQDEVVRVDAEQVVTLPRGAYRMRVVPLDGGADYRQALFAYQVRYLADGTCQPDAARFGILPFDEVPVVEQLPDLNGDGKSDYRVEYSTSPTQVGTRILVGAAFPECVRTVFSGIGHVVTAAESKNGWRRLYYLSREYLPDDAKPELVREYGPAWSITWGLGYDVGAEHYLPAATPIRCERTDGVQRALGDPGPNQRASLIPHRICQSVAPSPVVE